MKVQYRIGTVQAGFMIGMALLIDLLQGLLFLANLALGLGILLDEFLSLVAAFLFWLWFTLSRIDFIGGKNAAVKALSALSGTITELLPIIDGLPALTATVAFLVHTSRKEDREKAAEEETKAGQAAVLRARMREEVMRRRAVTVQREAATEPAPEAA